MRIKRHQVIPCRWFVGGIVEEYDGSEYWFFFLRLPSYQLMADLCEDRYRWHQLTIVFHGRDGFGIRWLLAADPDESI